ncbi:GNAT family N-acetyltransferase [Sphingobacterium sp. DK4209]|uniref:GNAT family N-acetyltransferase n=1 Tax=Sphingobacterium zhuxiongii TaxID=2662364 RepID=A0A5Q0Q6K3_9SPHI|nr:MULTISPECIES: GNAT family N-acetyltransferase [unclassified Sphingobacterium]MVZ64329.1 GNAT family N-acetyltransferase [Sphingobacterium sp. DK4209]QGA25677.1 GNAT family N-acetyltransferase [Sphingobacterium sp. dk4302]
MNWVIKDFDALSAKELYQILQVRIEVFMLEQNCLYPECDNKDLQSKHLFLMEQDQCAAYARLLPPNLSYSNCTSIGRVVVNPKFRKQKLGQKLMKEAIQHQKKEYPNHVVRISAQQYLQDFYEKLGFIRESEIYLEDNIPHIEMALYS